jgi:type IV fimbrial biogenesis protein FimT
VLSRPRGYSLIEVLIALAILGVVMSLGVPAFNTMMKNFQIRSAAESLVAGLQAARNEAVNRNASVRFQLVTTLDNACALDDNGPHWMISRNVPTGKCGQTEVADFLEPNDTAIPQILQKRFAQDGTAVIAATAGGVPVSGIVFSSLGRTNGGIDTIDVTNPMGGACEAAGGPLRCMRILIGAGGKVKMCDPKVTVATDSRYCQ